MVPLLVPECVPLRLLPVTVPLAATDVGVIAPRLSVMAGVVVDVATLPVIPFAAVTDTLLTVGTQVPSARKTLFDVPSPAAGAGTKPAVPPSPLSPTKFGRIDATCAPVRSETAPLPDVDRPLIDGPVMFASLAFVTAPVAMVVVSADVPADACTSPDKLIDWSPVLVPVRLDPLTAPDDVTDAGVMCPSPIASVPDVVIGLPDTLTPFDPVALTDVTVPPIAPELSNWVTVARLFAPVDPSTSTV